MPYTKRIIIGYFHICQIKGWKRSFDMIMDSIKNSGLYNELHEIRCGIINDSNSIIKDNRLNDPKITIIYYGKSNEYERPTLLHMRIYANTDPVNTAYFYLHTKGLRHFGTNIENNIIDWINLLLYWNITQWKLALNMLNYYDTYGCNVYNHEGNIHYSGNFWWTIPKHLHYLPEKINDSYTDPEFWITIKNDKMCNIYTKDLEGDRNYSNRMNKNEYEIPSDFNIDSYKYFNEECNNLKYDEIIMHYLNYGKYKNLIYKIPEDFDINFCRYAHKMENFTDAEILLYWNKYGIYKNLITKLPDDFNFNKYRDNNEDLKDFNNEKIMWHWANYGINENRKYK
jgi:hypothetical protein